MVLFPAALMEADGALGFAASVATVVYLGLATVTLAHALFGFVTALTP